MGELCGSCGIRFSPDGGHILVAESSNKRLSLFTLAGEFVRRVGVPTLKFPTDVDFAPSGDMVVVDQEKHRVSLFPPDGSTMIRTFGSEGSSPGQFLRPTALAMQGGLLYVLDLASARVQVFH